MILVGSRNRHPRRSRFPVEVVRHSGTGKTLGATLWFPLMNTRTVSGHLCSAHLRLSALLLPMLFLRSNLLVLHPSTTFSNPLLNATLPGLMFIFNAKIISRALSPTD